MIRRKLTSLVALVAAALAALVLTGCGSKAGAAATVGSHRISDSDVTRYLTSDAAPFSVQSQSGAPQVIVPRSYVLTALIREQLFTKALAATSGGVPNAAAIDAAEQQLTQGASRAQQAAQYTQYGFTAKFARLDVKDTALEGLLAQRVGATTGAGPLLKAIRKLHLPVTVSSRYGEWVPAQLAVASQPSDGVPSFIDLHLGSYPNQVPQIPAG